MTWVGEVRGSALEEAVLAAPAPLRALNPIYFLLKTAFAWPAHDLSTDEVIIATTFLNVVMLGF